MEYKQRCRATWCDDVTSRPCTSSEINLHTAGWLLWESMSLYAGRNFEPWDLMIILQAMSDICNMVSWAVVSQWPVKETFYCWISQANNSQVSLLYIYVDHLHLYITLYVLCLINSATYYEYILIWYLSIWISVSAAVFTIALIWTFIVLHILHIFAVSLDVHASV